MVSERQFLYKYPDGSHEVIEEHFQLTRTRQTMKRMSHASFILDLTTGYVVKNRYNNEAGTVYKYDRLQTYRVKYLNQSYFNEELFTL